MRTNFHSILILVVCLSVSCKTTDTNDGKYKYLKYNFYSDRSGNLYYRNTIPGEGEKKIEYKATMPLTNWEVYDSLKNFIDIPSFTALGSCGYAKDKNYVYYFIFNSDGTSMRILNGADPNSITYWQELCFLKDNKYLYFNHTTVPGFQTDSVLRVFEDSVHKTTPAYTNAPFYYTDEVHVFYGNMPVESADPETFRLIFEKTYDAEDKNGKYFEGRRVL